VREMTDIVAAQRDIARQSRQTEKIIAIYNGLVDRVPA
ncbi:MAG: hypothetical protein QOC58_2384, partial [Mycobacterium sp.]|nr:hypothetical protein [Mycobacterium sp.]